MIDSGVLNSLTSTNSNTPYSLGKSMKSINIEDFLIGGELEDYISHMMALNVVAKIEMASLYSKSETILELINAELDNK